MRDGGAFGFLRQLIGRAAREPPPEPPPEPEEARPPRPPRGQGPELRAVLGRQILEAHLRRRHDVMAGDTADLADASVEHRLLLARAMIAAAHADGGLDALEEARIRRALAALELDAPTRAALIATLSEPPSLEAVLREVHDPQAAAQVYAVSVRTVRRGHATNRIYLDYLAQRLKLPADVVVRLNRRWDVPA